MHPYTHARPRWRQGRAPTHRQAACRPRLGHGVYAQYRNGDIQVDDVCDPLDPLSCTSTVLEADASVGTTIAWLASGGAATAEAGARVKASAQTLVQDRDGVQCIRDGDAPAVSHQATRTQWEVTCIVVDSPDDVPQGPLLPDVAAPGAQEGPLRESEAVGGSGGGGLRGASGADTRAAEGGTTSPAWHARVAAGAVMAGVSVAVQLLL